MAECLYSWSSDVLPDTAHSAAAIVCARARETPLVHEDHHVRIEKVGEQYLVTVKGVASDGRVERQALVPSLVALAARAPFLVGPKESPPPLPRPRFRTDIYVGGFATIASVGNGAGASFTITHDLWSGDDAIALAADVRFTATEGYLGGIGSGGVRAHMLGLLYGGLGLGVGTIDQKTRHAELTLPAYMELGVDLFRGHDVGLAIGARVDHALAQGLLQPALINEPKHVEPLPQVSHGPFLDLGVMVRF